MSNQEKYDQIFINVFGVAKESLNEQFTFRDIPQWDSVAHLSLISDLEDGFDIMFESEDILHFGSYNNGKTILRKYGIEL